MKKRSLGGMLVLLLTFGFIMTGCATVDTINRENRGDFRRVSVPDKDFTAVGLVFSEKSYDLDEKGARGDIFTYYALLQEAKKLGADYIINVTIDVKTEGTFKTFFGKKTELVKGKETWYGAATAIKYTTALKNTEVSISPVGNSTVNNTKESFSMSRDAVSPATNNSIKSFFDKLFKK